MGLVDLEKPKELWLTAVTIERTNIHGRLDYRDDLD